MVSVDTGASVNANEAGDIDNPLSMHPGEGDESISKDAQKSIFDALEGSASARGSIAVTRSRGAAARTATEMLPSWPMA